MFWEELNVSEFVKAHEVAKGTCIIPFGVIEKHNGHMPLGTDMITARKIAEEAAKIEPVVIFPYYFFGQINEARHTPGTIAIHPQMMFDLMGEICREIARNGFNKIIILSSHGGNPEFIKYFMQSSLYEKRKYMLYDVSMRIPGDSTEEVKGLLGTDNLGFHAGNLETSMIKVIRPDLVKMDNVEKNNLVGLGRLRHLDGIYTAINWYSEYPDHYAGEPYHSNPEAGKRIIELITKRVADAIKLIKEDSEALKLQDEFFARCEKSD